MPAKRGKPEHRLEDALGALRRALSSSGAPWMIIGGIAVIARGVRRMTTDIDAVVRGDAIDVRSLVGVLRRHAIEPRVSDAIAFAEKNLVLLVRHVPTGVDLDISFAWSAFEHEAIEARSATAYGRITAPMATPEDLVVLKVIAARPKDFEDAEALLVLHASIDVARVRRRVAELAELAGADELPAELERLLARARRSRKRRRPRRP